MAHNLRNKIIVAV